MFFFSCVGEDIIDDYVDPDLRIVNPILSISEGFSYQFKVFFFDESGTKVNNPKIMWSVTPELLASIDDTGTMTAHQSGSVTVKVTSVGLQGKTVESMTSFEILPLSPPDTNETSTHNEEDQTTATGTVSESTITTTSTETLTTETSS